MRTKRYATPRDDRRRNGEVHTLQVDPAVMREALREAGGDPRRLTIDRDGSVTVHNHPRN